MKQQQREMRDLEIKSSPAPGEFRRAGHFELIELDHWSGRKSNYQS
ncbi:hypothetical protein RDI58_019309 [Solanum bulbocastanum]|uniref:Uncharacterized protein n=1 Tax=Solanum bulbocastanum TaxID=147425 RepID=A0AAN8Y9I9_SOLBU